MADQKIVRRLAAIVAADVVGYSRLMEANEAGTLARLKKIRKELIDPKIAEFGGRIVKTIGDGVLVEYGSVTDAVQSCVDIQRAMVDRNAGLPEDRRMYFRVGINLGEIIIEDDDIYGTGVNVTERLQALSEPGGICISGTVYDQIQNILKLDYEDLGEQTVKNIAAPVRSFAVRLGGDFQSATPAVRKDHLVAGHDIPAIAVLPFDNMSGDPEQEYFADGIAEDLITALSHFRWLFVIARNSSFTYKGKAIKIQLVAKELGARYVIEGSVRKGGNRVRISVQLINAETGHHIWAERFDREMEDIFTVQDEITERIATFVAPELERVELQRLSTKRPGDLQAWDLFLRGNALLNEFSKEGNEGAREMFERAVALDPNYSRGHAGLSYSHYRDLHLGFAEDTAQSLQKCLASAKRAVSLDDTDAFAHFVLSRGLHLDGRIQQALTEAERAIDLNPNDALGHASLGTLLTAAGRPNEGVLAFDKAFQLSPRDPRTNLFLALQSSGYFLAGRFDEAAAAAREAATWQPADAAGRIFLAASLAGANRLEEAAKVLASGDPIDMAHFERLPPTNLMTPTDRDRVVKELRRAGWEG